MFSEIFGLLWNWLLWADKKRSKQFGLRQPLQIVKLFKQRLTLPTVTTEHTQEGWLLEIVLTIKSRSWQQYWKRRIGSGFPRSGKVQRETFIRVWKEFISPMRESEFEGRVVLARSCRLAVFFSIHMTWNIHAKHADCFLFPSLALSLFLLFLLLWLPSSLFLYLKWHRKQFG